MRMAAMFAMESTILPATKDLLRAYEVEYLLISLTQKTLIPTNKIIQTAKILANIAFTENMVMKAKMITAIL